MREADYIRITSLTEDIVVVDAYGNVSKFGTASAYELFQLALESQGLTLYDDVEKRWLVGTADARGVVVRGRA